MNDYKIVYVSYVRSGRGDEVHTRQFSAAARRGHGCLTVFAPRLREDAYGSGAQRQRPAAAPDPFREMRWLGGVLGRRLGEQIALVRREKPDVVILRACRYLSLVWLCRLMRIPILLEVNAPMLERRLLPAAARFRGLSWWCRLEARLFGLADHVMVVSEPLRRYYQAYGIPRDRISVVPNGVDIAAFAPGRSGAAVRQAHGLDGRMVIGFVGSFTPWHGLDFLLTAVRRFVQDNPGQRGRLGLLLVGGRPGGQASPQIEGVKIVITGKVPHDSIPEQLAAMDIVTAPYPPITPFYFSPLKLFEAMAAGKPVIASRQGQIADLIDDGRNGMLYPPGDLPAFLGQLQRLIASDDLRRTLGRGARQTIEDAYTWDANAARMLELCKRLADSKKKRA